MGIVESILMGIGWTVLMYAGYHMTLTLEERIDGKIIGCLGTLILSGLLLMRAIDSIKTENEYLFPLIYCVGFLFVHYSVFKRLITNQK